jgi:hypothetical protein
MEFFNRKEEVLEVTLTQKGKNLLSSGSFRPVYYSFHDTDIVYDNGANQEQNEIVPRIKETPRLKQNTSIFQNSSNSQFQQNQEQFLYCEIGSKTILDQYKPAWELNFVSSPSFQYVGNRNTPTVTKDYLVKLSSSIDNNNANQESIPQIDIQTIYGIMQFGTGSKSEFYLVKDGPIVVEVSEFNSFEASEEQEFEIEAFYISQNEVKQLSFDTNEDNNVFEYLNILFDNLADFEHKINIKTIYGELVDRDESRC